MDTYDYDRAGEVDLLTKLLEADDQNSGNKQVYARSRQLVPSKISKPFALRSWYSECDKASQKQIERQQIHKDWHLQLSNCSHDGVSLHYWYAWQQLAISAIYWECKDVGFAVEDQLEEVKKLLNIEFSDANAVIESQYKRKVEDDVSSQARPRQWTCPLVSQCKLTTI